MIVPARLRYVIIVLINISKVLSAVTTRSGNASQCRQPSNTTLDCSNLNLIAIPNDIPNTIQALNMSFNQLSLSADSFSDCCGNIQDIDLSGNEISSISGDVFKYLVNVKRIFLHNNSISRFEADTFQNLKHLERLDLSHNPLSIRSTFLVSDSLVELNLEDCNLEELPEGSFAGIQQLLQLSLLGNPFDESFDTSAFEDLKALTKLQIKNVSIDTVTELCEKLEGMDAINFEGFNLSCFLLINENSNFEDAIVGLDAPIEKPLQLPMLPAPTTTAITTVSTSTSTTQIPSIDDSGTAEKNTEKIITHDSNHHQNGVTNSPEVDHAVVDIDNQTIKYILIGILCVTLAGILIGFLCRADVCGIKTKLCRSKKSANNRRSPTDTVSPFEEIPLNTVTTNGKTVENSNGSEN